MTERPTVAEYASFYAGYVSLVPEADALAVLARQPDELRQLVAAVPAERESYRYAAGKWSIREVVGHVADSERIFGYRAFCISRGDQAPLPGFDEKAYIKDSGYDQRSLEELIEEFAGLRETNLVFLRRLDSEAWGRTGSANGTTVSVRALAFIMAGHFRHHLGVLRSRYGV